MTSIASEPYWLVCGLFWFVLFKKRPWQHCAAVLFQSHQSRQHASPMLCTRKWMGKKTRDGDFDVPQSVMCHQQPSLLLSVTMCLKELSGCRLIDYLKAPQARELRRDDPQSRKETVLKITSVVLYWFCFRAKIIHWTSSGALTRCQNPAFNVGHFIS